MTQWARAIRTQSNHLDAMSICLRPHRFEYALPHDLDLSCYRDSPECVRSWVDGIASERLDEVRRCLEVADYVVQADELESHQILDLFHRFTGVDLVARLTNRNVAIYHPGTAFRKNSIHRNTQDAHFYAQLTLPDLYRLGGVNARPVFPVLESIPTENQIRERLSCGIIKIVHTPSNPSVKGTIAIREVVENAKKLLPERNIQYEEICGASNNVIMQAKFNSHIHIDQFNDLGGLGVGGIGVSTFEGWAAGNLVLSSVSHITPAVWQAWNIDPAQLPVVDIGTDVDTFFQCLLALCSMSNSEIACLAIDKCKRAQVAFSPESITRFFENLFPEPRERSTLPTTIESPAFHRRSSRVVIVMPYWSSPGLFHKQRYANMLCSAFDAKPIVVTTEAGLYERVMAESPEIVITMNLPLYGVYSERLIHDLPRSIKLITWHEDLRRQMHPKLPEVLERSDAVISVLRQAVLCPDQFPQVANKLWRLPWFVPAAIPPYDINPNPIRRCLIPGSVEPERPLRWRAAWEVPEDLVAHLAHPGYGKNSYADCIVGKDFYDVIYDHACCLTDGGIYKYVVAKYIEIPFTGSLLVAEDIPDLNEMGYLAGQHYISVDGLVSIKDVVSNILANLEDYYPVRKAGQLLVMERHTERVRFAEAVFMAQQIRHVLR